MSHVSPVTACIPIRPTRPTQSFVSDGRGRAWGGQTCVRGVVGVGENHGSGDFVLPVDAVDEVVEAEEEAQPISTLPSPAEQTQSERDDHDLTHFPYRSWCRHCVEGRGIEMEHRSGDDHWGRSVALVCFDYMFITQGNAFT